MRELKQDLVLDIPISSAFEWFINLDQNYHSWHPISHENFQWISPKPVQKGSIFMIQETINGVKHRVFLRIMELVPNEKLVFSSIRIYNGNHLFSQFFSMLFTSLFRIKIRMIRIFETRGDKKTIIHLTHRLGSDLFVIDKIIDFLNERLLPIDHHQQHVTEEGDYMKITLEGK